MKCEDKFKRAYKVCLMGIATISPFESYLPVTHWLDTWDYFPYDIKNRARHQRIYDNVYEGTPNQVKQCCQKKPTSYSAIETIFFQTFSFP